MENFNRLPFYVGAIGSLFGILLATPILFAAAPMIDTTTYWIAFLGMAIALAFQVFGFYGFGSNYDEGIGILCAILSAVTAIAHAATGIIFIQYGYDLQYHDPETGIILLQDIPGMTISIFLSFGFLLLLMVMIAIMIALLGESVNFGFDNKVVVIIFIGAAALMPWTPINFFAELILVTLLFLTAQVPKEWKKIEVE